MCVFAYETSIYVPSNFRDKGVSVVVKDVGMCI